MLFLPPLSKSFMVVTTERSPYLPRLFKGLLLRLVSRKLRLLTGNFAPSKSSFHAPHIFWVEVTFRPSLDVFSDAFDPRTVNGCSGGGGGYVRFG